MPNDEGIYDTVDPESPDRCQGLTPRGGQCRIRKLPGIDYCKAHCGVHLKRQEAKSINLYNLAVHQQRMEHFRDHSQIKTLSNEIGLIRLLIEQKVNSCKDGPDLMISSQSISHLVTQASDLIIKAAKLENQMSQSLSKTQIESYASQVIATLSKHVEPDILEKVAAELAEALDNVTSGDKK